MNKRKNKSSVAIVYEEYMNENGDKKKKIIGYLNRRDEEQGLDIILDSKGYKIVAL